MAKSLDPNSPARVPRALLVALAVGAAIKIAFLVVHQQAPDFHHPWLDALYHDFFARGLATGVWVVPADVADPLVDKTPYARPPAYPFFLAVLYRVSGGSELFARGVQLALGVLGAYFAACIAARLRPNDSRVVVVAAAFVLLSPTLLYFEGELVAAGPTAVASAGLVLALLRLRERPSIFRAGATGLLLGVVGLLRPNLLLFAPVAAAFLLAPTGVAWWRAQNSKEALPATPARAAVVSTIVLTLGAVVVVLPITARNLNKSGEPVFISTNGGVTLLHGNHAGADGVTMSLPTNGPLASVQDVSPFAYRGLVDLVATHTKEAPSYQKTEAWFRSQATAWMRQDVGGFVSLTFKKALLFWGPREVSNNKQVALERDANRVLATLPARFPVLVFFAAIGLTLWPRRRRRVAPHEATDAPSEQTSSTTPAPNKKSKRGKKGAGKADKKTSNTAPKSQSAKEPVAGTGPVSGGEANSRAAWTLSVAFTGTAFLSVLFFLAASRFRAPLVPVLAALAAVGAVAVVDDLRSRTTSAVRIGAAVVAILIGAINWSGYAPDESQWRLDRARAHLSAKRIPDAVAELELAKSQTPNHPDVLVTLGVIAGQQGKLAAASALFTAAAKAHPTHLQAQAQLGAARLGLDDPAGALAAFDIVLARGGGDAHLHYNRGLALGRLGKHAAAMSAFKEALRIRPGFRPALDMVERLR